MSKLNIAVIGCGTSGLCAAKNSLQQGFDVTVFEQNEALGGIWWYTDETGKNKYGVNVHSATYEGLRTNTPHQLMEYPDFHYPVETISYPPHTEVLKFLHSYADHFDLKKHIKFSHLVIRVLPIEDGKWEIIVKDLSNNKFETNIYDAVFIANGHFAAPRIPKYPGDTEFKGQKHHSHDLRTAAAFKGETVLILGSGSSARDLVEHLSKTAIRLTWSQHKPAGETSEEYEHRKRLLPSNATLQEDVKRFTKTGAEFMDGTHEMFSVVFYATGYHYKFPFLSSDCGIYVDDNFVQPLYKQVLNIEHPTMAFIGIPSIVASTRMMDLQVRFALKYISGAKHFSSKAEMLSDMRIQVQIHWNKGYRKHETHILAKEQQEYFDQLAQTADIEALPPVLAAIHFNSVAALHDDPDGFRKYKYTIIDDNTFKRELENVRPN